MRRLTEEDVNEIINGTQHNVCHYISNSYKKHGIEKITLNHDDEVLERLFNYSVMESFDAEAGADGGWTAPERPGGTHTRRTKAQIFFDVFTGKLGEIALYRYLLNNGVNIEEPNISDPRGIGNYDEYDLCCNNEYIAVKTTSERRNLLLLLKDRYREDGGYILNIDRNRQPFYFNYYVLCRFSNTANLDRKNSLSNKDQLNDSELITLKNLFLSPDWNIEIIGFIRHDKFVSEVISAEQTVLQDSAEKHRCFGKAPYSNITKVDKDNYYVQGDDLNDISELIPHFKKSCGRVDYVRNEGNTKYAYIAGDDGIRYTVGQRDFEKYSECMIKNTRVTFSVRPFTYNGEQRYAAENIKPETPAD